MHILLHENARKAAAPGGAPPRSATDHRLHEEQSLVQLVNPLVLHLDDKVQALQLLLPELAGAPIVLGGDTEGLSRQQLEEGTGCLSSPCPATSLRAFHRLSGSINLLYLTTPLWRVPALYQVKQLPGCVLGGRSASCT